MKTTQQMDHDWIATARTLSEALPFLQRYDNAIIVISAGAANPDNKDVLLKLAETSGLKK